MPLSADTLIRRIKGAARRSPSPRVIRVLGVDDCAWCKGQNFGTILVDLERSQVVDLLPTRSAESFRRMARTASRSDHGQPRSPRSLSRGRPSRRTQSSPSSGSLSLGSNLTQAVERELAVNRRHLRIARPSAPALPASPTKDEMKSQTKQIRVRSCMVMQQMEVARQRRQQKLELFETMGVGEQRSRKPV
jgi:hypothetical protein